MRSAKNIVKHQNHSTGRRGRTGGLLSGAAAAVITAFGIGLPAVDAQAAIVYSGVVNLNAPSTFDGVYLNVVTQVSGVTPSAVQGWDINVWGSDVLAFFAGTGGGFVNGLGSSTTFIDNLALGTLVNGSQAYGGSSGTGGEISGITAFLLNSSNNYVGFKFRNEANNNQVNYGWLQLSLGSTTFSQPRSIVSWAYENSGASISVGNTGLVATVPEPGSLALVGMALAAGLGGLRRRKAAKTHLI